MRHFTFAGTRLVFNRYSNGFGLWNVLLLQVKDVLAALPKGQSESFQFHDASNRTLSRSNSSSSLSENNASETGHVVEWTTLDSQHQSVASLGNTHSQNDECLVDLRAHMQPAPYVVYNSTPLKQTYQLFRTMGWVATFAQASVTGLADAALFRRANKYLGCALTGIRCVKSMYCSPSR